MTDLHTAAVPELVEQVLAGQVAVADCPAEADWRDLWNREGLGIGDPRCVAIRGGARADRLAWVFVAGYQAALQQTFRDLPQGQWAAFVASEDRQNPADFPGTTATPTADGIRLNGCKSWVAQSRHLDRMIVTAASTDASAVDGETVCLLVPANATGVQLSHRDAPGFLPELSQGFARFTDVTVAPGQVFPGALLRAFGRAEQSMVLLAGAAFLLQQTAGRNSGLETRLTALVLALSQVAADPKGGKRSLAHLDREMQAVLQTVADIADSPAWVRDIRLLQMYSPAIQRRATRTE